MDRNAVSDCQIVKTIFCTGFPEFCCSLGKLQRSNPFFLFLQPVRKQPQLLCLLVFMFIKQKCQCAQNNSDDQKAYPRDFTGILLIAHTLFR